MKTMDEIKSLFNVLYPYVPDKDTGYQLYGLDKWDLFMRFVIAFHNGHTGIRYDDAYEADQVQERLDEMFGKGRVACRRGLDGRAVLFPLSVSKMGFTWYARCFFSSDDAIATRRILMRSIRERTGYVRPLFAACVLRCSSSETRYLREAELWENLHLR